ncbi:hypothetical protein GCM10007103_30000 [Salinimicrobium marinum]|uniref:Uncharacterized protein n=1 Tax=Salinimicrobium marinum TaxID=680283 RepID=A0A918SJS0_9FLAO|nr:dienelactone hydrolase family protein [Salinimicrobium marinum]GHA46938.1 hypothetical protein GCM10007103_30000 [Salinimicrobium marinum]
MDNSKKGNFPLQEEEIAQLSKQFTGVWMVGLLKNDPAVALAKVKIPVLAINGKNDVQVISSINLLTIENSLKKAGNKNVTIKEYDNFNHLFQESKNGLPNEYSEIKQTFSPEVLEDVKSWILEVTGN